MVTWTLTAACMSVSKHRTSARRREQGALTWRGCGSSTRERRAVVPVVSAPFRDHAEGALGEALRLDAHRVIQAGPVVLPRNGRRELHERGLVEVLAERREQGVRYLDRRAGHRRRVLDHAPFEGRERVALLEAREIDELLLGDAGCPAHGRADIH